LCRGPAVSYNVNEKVSQSQTTRAGLGGRRLSLSDVIEQYLMSLVKDAGGALDIQRGELAGHFGCAPSQISYVLETRFTTERGFAVSGRRGGKGYVRILRLNLSPLQDPVALFDRRIGDRISESRAVHCILWLCEQGLIGEREARLMRAAVGRDALRVEPPARDELRARLLRAMIVSLLTPEGE